MRLVLQMKRGATDDNLKFAAQIGAHGIASALPLDKPELGYYEFAPMVSLRSRVESYGLKLENIGLLPWYWCHKWILGLPGRDEQIENCQKTIRNMGAAGIPVLLTSIDAVRWMRTSEHKPSRAGALATGFDVEYVRDAPLMAGSPNVDASIIPPEQRRPTSDDQMWDNLAYFLKAVVPVAEEAGVKLALHPDDPPIPAISGIARIMRSPEAFRRAIDLVPSDSFGVCFCQGCFAEMGADVIKEIRYFGGRKKIFFVHFRNIKGTKEHFAETFPDEGQVDMLAAMRAYKEVGFDGGMSTDHGIRLEGDTEWGHRYWGYMMGYMRALVQAVESTA
ncbi:MAG: mannonate dehydratase [Chloroflexi bacterium]|nr:mannonate dehydratase [Chloroflexota bacterium]